MGRLSLVLVVAMLAAACGGSGEQPGALDTQGASAVTGDGVLDCSDDQVIRDAGIVVSAGSEQDAVAAALAQWTDEGGSIVEVPPDEFSPVAWGVVQDGRDVAVIFGGPEGEGDEWVVHDVRTCGELETGPAPIDGELDCATEIEWSMIATLDPTIPGLPSAEEALRSALEPYAQRNGGEIVVIDDSTGSLVVEQREQVVVGSSEVPAGGWAVSSWAGCEGFEDAEDERRRAEEEESAIGYSVVWVVLGSDTPVAQAESVAEAARAIPGVDIVDYEEGMGLAGGFENLDADIERDRPELFACLYPTRVLVVLSGPNVTRAVVDAVDELPGVLGFLGDGLDLTRSLDELTANCVDITSE